MELIEKKSAEVPAIRSADNIAAEVPAIRSADNIAAGLLAGAECAWRGEEPPERIQKILSAYGIASRREAEKMIAERRVTVNGVPAMLGQRAKPGSDVIAVDGEPIDHVAGPVYIMLNKPRGYITTVSDERGRKTVMDLIGGAGVRVYPVGRLDMESEGLLLLTNDGAFANSVAHPSGDKTKTYEVRVVGDAAGSVTVMGLPMEIGARTICAERVELLETAESGGLLLISIREGRNRQIRKMCAKCGLKVEMLKRVAIGPLELGSLETGEWRYLTLEEAGYFV